MVGVGWGGVEWGWGGGGAGEVLAAESTKMLIHGTPVS